MNDLIYVGKIVKPHGIKGELKVYSDFEKKDCVFVVGNSLIINNEEYIIKKHRTHQQYELIFFNDFKDINEVLFLKGRKVYIKRSDLNLKEEDYLYSDLIGYRVFDNEEEIGQVIDYDDSTENVILIIEGLYNIMIPMKGDYIEKVDIKNQKVLVKNSKDLII